MGTISKALLLVLTFSASVFADSIVWNDYRRELKKLTLKNHRPLDDYSESRKIVMQEIHLKQDSRGYFIEDVYCHLTFRDISPRRMPSHTDINIEHTWPQSRFSLRANRSFQKADLHHLYPTESRSNSIRGNHYFSEVANDMGVGSNCYDSRFGYDTRTGQEVFEPPQDHKGNVARALFYFSIRYDITIPPHEEMYLRMWNYADPVDADEMKRNNVVQSFQGNRNPFIDDPEYADLISDF